MLRPGKPTDRVVIEAFNGRLPIECLTIHWLLSRADKVEDRRRYCNEERSRGTVGNLSPILLQTTSAQRARLA
nr:integrase core domain-containing protein [Bradyrhizobium mercantei]